MGDHVRGRSSMQKARRLLWLLLALAGLLLIATFMTSGTGGIPGWVSPTAQAADKYDGGGACTNKGQVPSFGGIVVIGPGEVLCGDLTSFGGTVEVEGEIRGNVTAFGGRVSIGGDVNGDIRLYGSKVVLRNGSQVHGNVDSYGGSEQREKDTLLQGSIIDHTSHFWWFSGIGKFSFPFWPILAWVALGMILIKLLPEHVMFVRTTAATKKRRSIIIGLLSGLLAAAVLVIIVSFVSSDESKREEVKRILFRPETCLEMGLANDATRLRTASVRQDQRKYCVLVTLPNHLFCNASLLQAVSRTLSRTHPVGSVVLRSFNSHPHYLLERTQNML